MMSATTTRLRFFYGCIELQDRGPHIWRPNPHLQMSADEQWKHNERSGLSAGLLRGDGIQYQAQERKS